MGEKRPELCTYLVGFTPGRLQTCLWVPGYQSNNTATIQQYSNNTTMRGYSLFVAGFALQSCGENNFTGCSAFLLRTEKNVEYKTQKITASPWYCVCTTLFLLHGEKGGGLIDWLVVLEQNGNQVPVIVDQMHLLHRPALCLKDQTENHRGQCARWRKKRKQLWLMVNGSRWKPFPSKFNSTCLDWDPAGLRLTYSQFPLDLVAVEYIKQPKGHWASSHMEIYLKAISIVVRMMLTRITNHFFVKGFLLCG